MEELKHSIQYRAVITSFLLLGVYASAYLASEIYLMGTFKLDVVQKSIWQSWVNPIALIGCDLAVIVCIARSNDIQRAIKRLFGAHSNLIDSNLIVTVKVSASARNHN